MVYFFTNSYIFFGGVLGINAFYPVVVLYGLHFAVARPLQVAQVITLPITWVLALTALVPLVLFASGAGVNPFSWSSVVGRTTFFATFAGTSVLLLDPNGPLTLRRAARISLAIAVALNFFDLFLDNPFNRAEGTGRTAGLYSDANNSAAAIGTLLILSIDFSKQSVRDLLIVGISSLAIIATQSRSGMAFGALILLVYLAAPRGPETFTGAARIGLGLGGSLALALGAVVGFQLADLSWEQTWRIQSLLFLDLGDPSTTGRLDRASYAVEQFFKYFWTGRGLGGSRYYGIFSHNSFLEIGLDYGIGGVLVYVGLISYVAIKALRFGLVQNIGTVIIAIQIAYFSMFSHTVHSFTVFAVFFAAVAVNATISSPEERDGQILRR
ncbi:MAG: hypothetical protein NZ990_07100 [Myxococcota bacterium]|nr:hypothetical protein [Myxococcota bacterium]